MLFCYLLTLPCKFLSFEQHSEWSLDSLVLLFHCPVGSWGLSWHEGTKLHYARCQPEMRMPCGLSACVLTDILCHQHLISCHLTLWWEISDLCTWVLRNEKNEMLSHWDGMEWDGMSGGVDHWLRISYRISKTENFPKESCIVKKEKRMHRVLSLN